MPHISDPQSRPARRGAPPFVRPTPARGAMPAGTFTSEDGGASHPEAGSMFAPPQPATSVSDAGWLTAFLDAPPGSPLPAPTPRSAVAEPQFDATPAAAPAEAPHHVAEWPVAAAAPIPATPFPAAQPPATPASMAAPETEPAAATGGSAEPAAVQPTAVEEEMISLVSHAVPAAAPTEPLTAATPAPSAAASVAAAASRSHGTTLVDAMESTLRRVRDGELVVYAPSVIRSEAEALAYVLSALLAAQARG